MAKRVVIPGAGTAGTMMANKLVRALDGEGWRVTILDREDVHVYQPGLLFLPFQMYREEEVVKRRAGLLDARVELQLEGIERVAPDENRVYLRGGSRVDCDIRLVAAGSPGWRALPPR